MKAFHFCRNIFRSLAGIHFGVRLLILCFIIKGESTILSPLRRREYFIFIFMIFPVGGAVKEATRSLRFWRHHTKEAMFSLRSWRHNTREATFSSRFWRHYMEEATSLVITSRHAVVALFSKLILDIKWPLGKELYFKITKERSLVLWKAKYIWQDKDIDEGKKRWLSEKVKGKTSLDWSKRGVEGGRGAVISSHLWRYFLI